MKIILAIAFCLALVNNGYGARDYFKDEEGETYIIGVYGERIYEDDNGNIVQRVNKVRAVEIKDQEITKFGWELFKNTHKDAPNNFVISSLSPQVILSFIARESQNKTRKEITKVIGTEENLKLGKLIKSMLIDDSARELLIATGLFVTKDLQTKLKQSYIDEGDRTTVDVLFMDFKNSKQFNTKYSQWVQKNTNGKLDARSLQVDPNAKMIMSGTMYFKGTWLFEFTPTENGMFHKSENEKFKVSMMKSIYKKYHYGHLSDNLGEWLSIPYNSTESLLILLPNRTTDVDRMISSMPYTDITDIMRIIIENKDPYTLVNITMPKFKIDSTTDLKKGLEKMGVKRIFNEQSQFMPLTDEQPMQISSAMQQTTLTVDETGSVGASVTKFSVVGLSVAVKIERIHFNMDRPFVAVVINRLYQVPYFIAKVKDPRSTEE